MKATEEIQVRMDPMVRKMLLIDGVGAVVSVFFLSVVLVHFQAYIGLSVALLYMLGALAGVLALYSLSSALLQPRPGHRYLRLVALANLAYCGVTAALVILHASEVQLWGYLYFGGEIAVVTVLASMELRTARKAADVLE